MKIYHFLSLLFCFLITSSAAQISVKLNAWADIEASKGDSTSHFYYNEIHTAHKDWRVSPKELNLLTEIEFSPTLSLNLRARMSQKNGSTFDQFDVPLANIKYSPKDKDWTLSVGRFITPFGSFADKQHSKERVFINLPLAYGYYTNISTKIGFAEQLGEAKIKVDDAVDWGTTLLYYGTYSNGLRLDWKLIPDKVNWSIALTNSASNTFSDPFDFSNWGVTTKLKLQPKYFWEQQVSFSYGSFQNTSQYDDLLSESAPFQQMLIGTDALLGVGFWEFSAELMGALYHTPWFVQGAEGEFLSEDINLSSFSANASVKYEFSFLSGLYAAYGIDYLSFGALDDRVTSLYGAEKWDDTVLRHNFGLGYKITNFLLLRSNYMLQTVENHPVWAQNTWRSTLTVFF